MYVVVVLSTCIAHTHTQLTTVDGAGLVYTSAKKEDGNIELLFEYMRHLLYYYDYQAKPQLLERELTFIPIGADSMSMYSSLSHCGEVERADMLYSFVYR
jgi:hypothetical protein